MTKPILVLLFALAASAQTWPAPDSAFHYSGWVNGCTRSNPWTSTAYLDTCVPTNLKPLGTFTPESCKWYSNPNTQLPMKLVTPESPRVLAYATQAGLSRNNSHVMVGNRVGGLFVYSVSTCASVRQLSGALGETVWSSLDNDAVYYTSGHTIRRQLVSTGVSTEVIAMDGTGGKPNFTAVGIELGGSGEPSKDDWLAFNEKTTKEYVCVVYLPDPAKWGCVHGPTATGIGGWMAHDFTMVSKGIDSVSHRRYVWVQGGYGTLFEFTDASPVPVLSGVAEDPMGNGDNDGINEAGETIFGSRHIGVGETADGRQFLLTYELTGSSIAPSLDIALFHYGPRAFGTEVSGGGVRRIMYAAGYPAVSFQGCARNAHYCVISAGGGAREVGDTTSPYRQLHLSSGDEGQELGWGLRQMWLIYNAGERITFLGNEMNEHYFSDSDPAYTFGSGAEWYYQFPLASLSMDGSHVAFVTNHGVDGVQQVVVAHGFRDSKNLRITEKTTTGGKVRFVAPNASDCTVTISVNANFSSPLVNAAAVSGHAERLYSFTTGVTGTLYYVRATCAGLNADTSFTTR